MILPPPRLRPAQQAVLEDYKGGRLAIAAVPGSGKTFMVEQVVLRLISNGTAPDRIGVGTYMRSSRGNLAQKFANVGRVQVFTLHSLSLQILKEFYPGGFSFNVQEEYQKERLIDNLVTSWMELHRSVWHSWITDPKTTNIEPKVKKQLASGLNAFIGKAKHKCLSSYQIKAEPSSLLGVVIELYDRYERHLADQQRIDYDDMAVKAVSLLEENDYIRSVAQGWFDYLLEDEAQDSSPLQAKMLDLLSARTKNLIRVGDPNQCIMSTFSNSDPSIFRDFCSLYQRHTLNQSSRSSQKIITLANYLVDWTNNDHPLLELRSALKLQHIQAATDNPPDRSSEITFVKVTGTIEEELAEIVDRACSAILARPDHSVAILVLTNDQGNDVLDLLRQKGIKPNDLLRQNKSIKKLINTLCYVTKFLGMPTDIDILSEALGVVLETGGVGEAQIKLLQKELSKYYPEDLVYPQQNISMILDKIIGLELETRNQILSLLPLFSFWLEQSNPPWDEILRLIVQYLQQSPEDLYIGNYLISQLEQNFQEQFFVDWTNISYEISQIFERPLTNLPAEIQNYEPTPGVITVLTAHRSKGLEWDEVFMTNCTAYNFPALVEDQSEKTFDLTKEILWQWHQLHNPSGNSDFNLSHFVDQSAEKIRLLYVAITRAKKRLTLSVSTLHYDKEQRSSLLFDRLEEFNNVASKQET